MLVKHRYLYFVAQDQSEGPSICIGLLVLQCREKHGFCCLSDGSRYPSFWHSTVRISPCLRACRLFSSCEGGLPDQWLGSEVYRPAFGCTVRHRPCVQVHSRGIPLPPREASISSASGSQGKPCGESLGWESGTGKLLRWGQTTSTYSGGLASRRKRARAPYLCNNHRTRVALLNASWGLSAIYTRHRAVLRVTGDKRLCLRRRLRLQAGRSYIRLHDAGYGPPDAHR